MCCILQRYRFLMKLSKELPSMSPIDSSWPRSSVLYKSASEQLRVLYHKTRASRSFPSSGINSIYFIISYSSIPHNRCFLLFLLQCRRYRNKCDPAKRKILNEKVKASELFKDKKANYVRRWAIVEFSNEFDSRIPGSAPQILYRNHIKHTWRK